MKQQRPSFQVIYLEIFAFALIICISWGNELFNAAHRLFGGKPSSNWREALLESCVTILVAIPTILLTWRIAKRLYHLEEFMKICSWCHKVGRDDQWIALDEFFNSELNLETSQSICPACVEKLKNRAKPS